MSTHIEQTIVARVAPLKMIRQVLFRRRGVGALSLEDAIIERAVDREEKVLTLAAGEARGLEGVLARCREMASAALTDTVTPGVIDALEADGITRVLLRGAEQSHRHTQRLEALVS